MVNKPKNTFLSTSEAAQILGISRIAVFKRIKAGTISAHKVGHRYVIDSNQLEFLTKKLAPADRKRIEVAVKRTLQDYGDVIKKLGRE
jgi:excisionase family DNA binding protein